MSKLDLTSPALDSSAWRRHSRLNRRLDDVTRAWFVGLTTSRWERGAMSRQVQWWTKWTWAAASERRWSAWATRWRLAVRRREQAACTVSACCRRRRRRASSHQRHRCCEELWPSLMSAPVNHNDNVQVRLSITHTHTNRTKEVRKNRHALRRARVLTRKKANEKLHHKKTR